MNVEQGKPVFRQIIITVEDTQDYDDLVLLFKAVYLINRDYGSPLNKTLERLRWIVEDYFPLALEVRRE